MEHRWGERVAVRVPVELSGGCCPALMGSLENVSSSGAFIRIRGAVPPRGPVQVRLAPRPSSGRRRAARIAGYIVRRAEDGIGVEWRQFAPLLVRELMSRSTQTHRPPKHKGKGSRPAREVPLRAELTH
jgi:hypothetical protein